MTTFARDWTGAYEGQPSDGENVNLGATRIRNLKVDVRERLQVDHAFGDNGPAEADDGKHLKVTLLVRSSAPGLDAGSGALYSQTINSNVELMWKDVAGNILQITTAGRLNPAWQGPVQITNGQLYLTADSYIYFNGGTDKFEFWVRGVLKGTIPP